MILTLNDFSYQNIFFMFIVYTLENCYLKCIVKGCAWDSYFHLFYFDIRWFSKVYLFHICNKLIVFYKSNLLAKKYNKISIKQPITSVNKIPTFFNIYFFRYPINSSRTIKFSQLRRASAFLLLQILYLIFPVSG